MRRYNCNIDLSYIILFVIACTKRTIAFLYIYIYIYKYKYIYITQLIYKFFIARERERERDAWNWKRKIQKKKKKNEVDRWSKIIRVTYYYYYYVNMICFLVVINTFVRERRTYRYMYHTFAAHFTIVREFLAACSSLQ